MINHTCKFLLNIFKNVLIVKRDYLLPGARELVEFASAGEDDESDFSIT